MRRRAILLPGLSALALALALASPPPAAGAAVPAAEAALARAREAYARAKAAAEAADRLRAGQAPGAKIPSPLPLFAEAADAFARAAAAGAETSPSTPLGALSLSKGPPGTGLGALDFYQWAVAEDEARRPEKALDRLVGVCFLLERVERPEGPEWAARRASVHRRLARLYEARGYATAAYWHVVSAARMGDPEAAAWADRARESFRRGLADDPKSLPLSPAVAADLILYSREAGASRGLLGPEAPRPSGAPSGAPAGAAADAALRALYAEGILWLLAAPPEARAGTVFEEDPTLAGLRLWEVAQALVEHGAPDALARLERALPSLGLEPIRQAQLRRRMVERLGALSGEASEEALAGYLLAEDEELRGEALRALAARVRRPKALARRILSAVETTLREAAAPPSPRPSPPGDREARRRSADARARNGLMSLKSLAGRLAPAASVGPAFRPARPTSPAPSPEPTGPVAEMPPDVREVLDVEDLPQLVRIAELLSPDAGPGGPEDPARPLARLEARTLIWDRVGASRRPEAFRALLYLARPLAGRGAAPAGSEPRPTWVPSLAPTGPPPPAPSPSAKPPVPGPAEAPFAREARATLRLRSPTAWGVELSAEERALWDEIRQERKDEG